MGNETSATYFPFYLHDLAAFDTFVLNQTSPVGGAHIDRSVAINVVQISLGVSITIVNAILMILLIANRSKIQWKRYGLVLSFTAGDLLSGILLIVLASVWMPLFSYRSAVIAIVLEAVKFFSLIISTFTYAGMMVLQYIALEKPLLYRLKLSIRYVFYLAGCIWLFAPVYVVAKSRAIMANPYHIKNYALAEIVMALSIGLVIFFCYVYILRVACGQSKRRRMQTGASLSLTRLNGKTSGLDLEYATTRSQQPLSGRHQSFSNKFMLISGLRMVSFVLTLSPICVYGIVRIAADRNNDYRRITYAYNTTTRHYLLLLWFSRGLTDPIVHLLLDSRLWILRRRDSAASNMPQSIHGSSF